MRRHICLSYCALISKGWHVLGVLVVVAWLAILWTMFARSSPKDALPLSVSDLSGSLSTSEEWMGAYYHGRKLGYFYSKIQKEAPHIKLEQRAVLKFRFAGLTQEITSKLNVVLEPNFSLNKFEFEAQGGTLSFGIKGKMKKEGLLTEIHLGAQSYKQLWPMDQAPLFNLVVPKLLALQELRQGLRYKMTVFAPQSLSNQPTIFEIVGTEAISLQGILVPVIHFRSVSNNLQLDTWMDEYGVVLREEYPFGLLLKKEEQAQATEGIDSLAPEAKELDLDKLRQLLIPNSFGNQ